MKILNSKVFKILYFSLCIIIPSILSKVHKFNYINYKFLPARSIFITLGYFLPLLLYLTKNKISNIKLDDIFYFKLHILLNVMWIFLFFLYKETIISLFVIIFNMLIAFIMIKRFCTLYKRRFIYYIYFLWFMYLVLVNLLIIW